MIGWLPLSGSLSKEASELKVSFSTRDSKNLDSMMVSDLVYLIVLCDRFLIEFVCFVDPKTLLLDRIALA